MHDWEVMLFLAGVLIQSLNLLLKNFIAENQKNKKENKDDTIKELKSERDYWHELYIGESQKFLKEESKLKKEEKKDKKK